MTNNKQLLAKIMEQSNLTDAITNSSIYPDIEMSDSLFGKNYEANHDKKMKRKKIAKKSRRKNRC